MSESSSIQIDPRNRTSQQDERSLITRLAPSPTGALHLGNARTFIINWILARQRDWRILLRIEDLDSPRIKPDAERQTIETLQWLGLDWDLGPIRQSDDLTPYRDAMRRLAEEARSYPCELTRKEIEAAASAPHPGEDAHELRYPPELRPAIEPRIFQDAETNWRFITPDDEITFHDEFHQGVSMNPGATVGDFVIWTKRGQPAYQLAVVVDDHRQGVTHIVRGDDLLDSAARQILLYRALNLSPIPAHLHLPIVIGPDGRRLAKRHGDTRVITYRDSGVSPERVLGLLAFWSGVRETDDPAESPRPMSLDEFAERFQLATMPREQIICRPEDDAWLRER